MLKGCSLALCLLLWLAGSVAGREITLEWDPNNEADIAGYKIYYQVDRPDLPLDGTGAVQGPSPVDIGKATTITLQGLQAGQIYYFAATAYNSAGYESSFSNIVASDWVPAPLSPAQGAIVDGPSLQFSWSAPPPGLNVTYTLYYGPDAGLQTAIAAPPPAAPSAPFPLYAPVLATLLLCALFLAMPPRPVCAAAVLAGGLLLASCGGGGDDPQVREGSLSTIRVPDLLGTDYTIDDLKAGTYYWKVVADDGALARESTVTRFTVR